MKKQMLLKDLTVGMEFEALGHKFVLLDTIFYDKYYCIFNEILITMPFYNKQKPRKNKLDFSNSDIITWLDYTFLETLYKSGADSNNIINFNVSLNYLINSFEYNTCQAKLGLLSLEEFAEYYDIIPTADYDWWLSTTLQTPKKSYRDVVYVDTKDNWGFSDCANILGVRPTITFNEDFKVYVEDDEED